MRRTVTSYGRFRRVTMSRWSVVGNPCQMTKGCKNWGMFRLKAKARHDKYLQMFWGSINGVGGSWLALWKLCCSKLVISKRRRISQNPELTNNGTGNASPLLGGIQVAVSCINIGTVMEEIHLLNDNTRWRPRFI